MDEASPPMQLPNPLTPMAFLPPMLATQVTTGVYVLVGGCAVFVWDFLDNLRNDYRLLTKYRIRLPTIAYMISRLGTLGLVLSGAIFGSAAITTDCARFHRVVGAFYPITIPATSLLFFFRLRAVFNGNKIVVMAFAFIWLTLFASSISVPFGLIGTNIGPTEYCVTKSIRTFIVAPTIISFVHDTLVLFAISWKLMAFTHEDLDVQRGVKSMVLGDYLPTFSRSLLHGGQLYYSATVSLNLLTVIMFFIESVPPTYRLMFTLPNVTLMNIMACRVFRNTKFGLLQDSSMSTGGLISTSNTTKNNDRVGISVKFASEEETTSTSFEPPSSPKPAVTASRIHFRNNVEPA
ncbi:hypothetical protein CVT24_010274 [Panaeolus cyanescens]|uniref:G-protein coupled receptors family 1 profile domain-containing protein n=1 Tax=Panaeolus cyanescens TaxID=181874 RepID=A0A409W8Y6_9AGAR|nr:hypothetical protein CVT24_010274 [Panaeolus cyanescens]